MSFYQCLDTNLPDNEAYHFIVEQNLVMVLLVAHLT